MRYINKITIALAMMTMGTGSLYAQSGKWSGLVKLTEKSDTSKKEEDKPKKDKIKKFDELISKDAVKSKGLFNSYRVGDKYYMEIPDSLLNRDMLVVTRFTQTPVGLKEFRSQYGGEMINDQLWQWHRRENTIYIRVPSYAYMATGNTDIHQALANSNAMPILAAFDIKAFNEGGRNVVIDVTDFYNGDIPGMQLPENLKKTYKIAGIDASRSYIDTVKAFPENVEVRTIKTFKTPDLPADKTVGAMTFGLNTSMVLLPKVPMQPRYDNQRVGYFSNRKIDFGANDQKVTKKAFIQRWRLEPSDLGAYNRGELVKPKKQIVYYIDPATPKKWVPYLIAGVNDWNEAFEAAGFKEAIVAREAPTPQEDPEFSTEDARYSVIRYFASETENAYGPRISDPRSGEIIESHIGWYHNVMSLLRNWFFVQTAAIHDGARGAKLSDEQMGQLVRFVSSHEVGHTLGLLHNFGSSAAYDVDSLRSPAFTEKYGTAPSVMDYARFNYVAQPGDGVKQIYPKIGEYDRFAIDFGYRYFTGKTPEQEERTLDLQIREKVKNPVYFYGRQGSMDPRAQSEDLGNDAVKASDYGIANLRYILPNLEKWTYDNAEDLSGTKELYLEIMRQYRRYVNHVLANVAAMTEDVKTMGEPGAVFTYVSKDKQQKAVDFVGRQVFQTPTWLLDSTLLSRVDYGTMVNRIVEMQNQVLTSLMETYGFARMLDDEFKNGNEAYTVKELLNDLEKQIFESNANDVFSRGLQRAYVDRLGVLLKLDKPVQETAYAAAGLTPYNPNLSDMRIIMYEALLQVEQKIAKSAKKSKDFEAVHYKDLLNRIENIKKLNK
ncbi:Glutamyl- and glutaminyl-tRNA synthetases [Sphingobacterium spiritivorum]|uniref:Glutamyl- and glutaminyl-tRNA synthetases n=1 Tax=Sphingobacterium spiritivorum TaxID=258 RepID=A0A380CYG3_SPHSI|nr:zinc-dependent metalloprotease [Sphingobacterium spiritivorum]SUJ30551.1 Glutamyl- and glutaminyl-tRNA synthetases [Sphingobacterium spiritivorum]